MQANISLICNKQYEYIPYNKRKRALINVTLCVISSMKYFRQPSVESWLNLVPVRRGHGVIVIQWPYLHCLLGFRSTKSVLRFNQHIPKVNMLKLEDRLPMLSNFFSRKQNNTCIINIKNHSVISLVVWLCDFISMPRHTL